MSSFREKWAASIRASDGGKRYLYARGHALRKDAEPLASAQLLGYLKRLSQSKNDIRLLAQLFFLTSASVKQFIHIRLPKLLRTLSQSANARVELSRRGVRGKVLWSHTLRLRLAGRADQGTYVVRRGVKSSDVAENQLLKLFLTEVDESLREATRAVGDAVAGLPPELHRLKTQVESALRHPYLREVTRVRRATAQMKQKAKRARETGYRDLVRLESIFSHAVKWNRWEAIVRLIQIGWIEPIRDDDLFELYCLINVLKVLEQDLAFGEPAAYGLIRQNRGRVAIFARPDGAKAEVYFDQAPSTVTKKPSKSRYLSILRSYTGFRPHERRPDITVILTDGNTNEQRLVFLECKKTTDKSDYSRDSVYKVLGYLQDFEVLWENSPDQKPKAILFYPQTITPKEDGTASHWDVALVSGYDTNRLAALLKAAFGHAT